MTRREVLVPVVPVLPTVPPDAPAPVGICTLWCEPAGSGERPEDVPSAAELRLSPIAAPLLNASLNDANLYESGVTAAAAVWGLGLAPSRLALWQRLRPRAWLESRRLHAAGDLPALGRSAELGLALALLLPTARFRGEVMATGRLSDASGASRPGALRRQDTAVRPVGSIAEKLAGLRDRTAPPAGAAARRRALCFTPREDAHGQPVAALPVVAELDRLGVEVVPIGWLGEAVERLGAARWPLLPADRLAVAAGLALAGGLTLATALWLWHDWPIPLAFERGGGAAGAAEPYIACITPDGRYTVPQPIPRSGQIARLGDGQKLAWAVRVGDPAAWDARLMRTLGAPEYHLLFAVLFADGPPLLADYLPAGGERGTSPAQRAAAGALWEQWLEVPVGGDGGESALVVLARRHGAFDADALRRGLEALADPPGAERVYRGVNFLQSQAPGFLVYQFVRSSHVTDPCAP